MNRTDPPASRQFVNSSIARESKRIMGWVVACCSLFALHLLQLVALGQDWKDDHTGWSYMHHGYFGSGWLMWSVLVLFIATAVMIAGLVDESPKLLRLVGVLSVVRAVLVWFSTSRSNEVGLDSRFGIAATFLALIVTALVSVVVAEVAK